MPGPQPGSPLPSDPRWRPAPGQAQPGADGAFRCDGWPAGWSHSSNLLPIWTGALPTIQLVRVTNHSVQSDQGGAGRRQRTGAPGRGASGRGAHGGSFGSLKPSHLQLQMTHSAFSATSQPCPVSPRGVPFSPRSENKEHRAYGPTAKLSFAQLNHTGSLMLQNLQACLLPSAPSMGQSLSTSGHQES